MIPLFKVHMPPREELIPDLEKVLYSGYITQGEKVREFETLLGMDFCTANVLTTNSGTASLQLALRLAGVRGGNVVTTPMTCSATVLPVLAEGAVPVWADVDPESGNIDPLDVDRKIGPDTRAILAVHWGGQPGKMNELLEVGRAHDIPVIIDAAHALGAEWNGESIAMQADFTCYSLQAIKHITTGDGGFLVTKSDDDYERGKRLRWFGLDREAKAGDARVENDILEWGYKFHMNDIAATIGLAQLKHLKLVLARHRDNALLYDKVLPVPRQVVPAAAKGSWWLYTLLWDDGRERAEFMRWMEGQDIHVSRVHSRLDQLTCFKEYTVGGLRGVESFFERETCIPVHWGLSHSERTRIIEAVEAFRDGAGW